MVKIEEDDELYRIDDIERLVMNFLLCKPDGAVYRAEISKEELHSFRYGTVLNEAMFRSYLERNFELVSIPEIRLHVLYPFTVEEICS